MTGGSDLHHLVSKDARPLVRKALKAGWRLERYGAARTASGVRLVSPDGSQQVPVPRQGGGVNRLCNQMRQALRRHGIV